MGRPTTQTVPRQLVAQTRTMARHEGMPMKFGVIYELALPIGEEAKGRSESDVYWETIEQVVRAEEVGFEYAWFPEHHFLEDLSRSSAPEVFLSAVAQHTTTIRLGHGVVLMPPPFNHPFKVAEKIAALDILSRRIEKDPRQAMAEELGIPYHYGTIHCSALDANGDIGACTTTSGLSYKIPGRVGDSPIIGAGMFVQNEVGSAGATGRGESLIQSCGSFQIVQHMANGDDPTEACLKVLKWIADHTKRHDLLNAKGQPNFGATLYALRKDGAYGSATMRGGGSFTVHDGTEARKEKCAVLYE